MSDERKIINFWRGKRATFNALQEKDYYTKYSVLEADGSWSTYYGGYEAFEGGEKLPVEDIISAEDVDTIANEEGRYLVESGNGYSIVIHALDENNVMTEHIDPFPINCYSVRVKSQGMKAYVFTDGLDPNGERVLRTYDDVDCGAW